MSEQHKNSGVWLVLLAAARLSVISFSGIGLLLGGLDLLAWGSRGATKTAPAARVV